MTYDENLLKEDFHHNKLTLLQSQNELTGLHLLQSFLDVIEAPLKSRRVGDARLLLRLSPRRLCSGRRSAEQKQQG